MTSSTRLVLGLVLLLGVGLVLTFETVIAQVTYLVALVATCLRASFPG